MLFLHSQILWERDGTQGQHYFSLVYTALRILDSCFYSNHCIEWKVKKGKKKLPGSCFHPAAALLLVYKIADGKKIFELASPWILKQVAYWQSSPTLCSALIQSLFTDPEVHIALENLQQFPAFTSCHGETSTDHQSFCPSPLGRSPVFQTGEHLQKILGFSLGIYYSGHQTKLP